MTTISIVGPGRLGTSIAKALRKAGYFVPALVAHTPEKAKLVSQLGLGYVDPKRVLTIDQLDKLPVTDAILISTPDDAIEGVAVTLAKLRQFRNKNLTVLHTSGALSSEVLSPLAAKGFHTGSIHPLVSVNSPYNFSDIFRGVYYAIEGDDVAKKTARQIARDLGGKSFVIKSEHKALYHAAALIAAGHLTALIDLALMMLVACGRDPNQAQEILMPLVRSAVANLQRARPEDALTGTFARGDLATVEKHLQALKSEKLPDNIAEALEIYKLLGLRSLELAKKNKLDRKTATKIKKLLQTV